MDNSTYLDKIKNEDLNTLIISTCKLPLPDVSKSLHFAMPDLLEAMLIEYEKRGLELLIYDPPSWVISYIFDLD